MSNDWETVQEKAFTAWVNGVLKHVDEKVTDITQDFSDGIKLAHFLELLSGKKMPKKPEEARSRIHKINNVFLAMQFLEQMEVKVEGVAAEDFVDSNKKLILGFLWTLYRKYRIHVIKEGDKSSEEGLLLWCKNTTAGYDGVDIKSFKTGFRDGHAFLALAHKYDPAQFNYDELNKLSPDQRLEKAFEIAEKTINIPKLLDVNEVMKGTADERALILYTSLFFHAFSAQAQARAAAGARDSLQDQLSSAQQSKEELMKKVSELEKANAELKSRYEDELKKLKEQPEIQTDRANTQTKRGDDLQARLTSSSKRADQEFSLLLLLRQQFDQHVLDMHNWRKLVEVDTVADFLMEVKTPLVEELAKAGGFDVQVSKLRGSLENETKVIHQYLKDKEDFNKQKISKK
uniref:Actin-binding protein n=1 Tax=Physarum polycephalum TaxID=5791 RepID=Q03486_PHYPO|nr:actin-binding protein [Physarum polycephalum]